MTPNRLKQFEDIVIDDNGVARFIYDIPCNNKYLQYCSYLRRYLVIQDCIKDCHINIEDNE